MLTGEEQIFEQINKAKNILIAFNKNWDGDSVASALAMKLFLKKIGKKAIIAAEKSNQNYPYSFLPSCQKIKNNLESSKNFVISLDTGRVKVKRVKYSAKENKLDFIITPEDGLFQKEDVSADAEGFAYDLIITIDTPDLESLGKIYDENTNLFYGAPIINIDNHADNEKFGQINHVDLVSVSTAEILFSLFKNYSANLIDEDIATCLLAAMISKTKSFKTRHLTPKSLSDAAELITLGARREEIVNAFYRSRSIGVLKLWGRVLARLNSDRENKLVWSTLTNLDFEKTDTNENDIKEVIDELIINIPQAQIIVIIFESQEKKETSKAIIYSIKNINSIDLVKEWDPEGTKNLVLVSKQAPISEFEKKIIYSIKNKLEKLPL